MVIDEHELRQRLDAAAADVSAPHLTTQGLIGRIRRRRAKIISLFSVSFLAVAAIAIAVPIGLAGGGKKATTPGRAPIPPSYVLTLNGRLQIRPWQGPAPTYHVRNGEHLDITVEIRVPRQLTISHLWLGISTGTLGASPNGPVGMHPILASSHRSLSPGSHTFTLHWRMPRHRSAAKLYLVSAWTTRKPSSSTAEAIAVLAR
jgi:hypothetical protein